MHELILFVHSWFYQELFPLSAVSFFVCFDKLALQQKDASRSVGTIRAKALSFHGIF